MAYLKQTTVMWQSCDSHVIGWVRGLLTWRWDNILVCWAVILFPRFAPGVPCSLPQDRGCGLESLSPTEEHQNPYWRKTNILQAYCFLYRILAYDFPFPPYNILEYTEIARIYFTMIHVHSPHVRFCGKHKVHQWLQCHPFCWKGAWLVALVLVHLRIQMSIKFKMTKLIL